MKLISRFPGFQTIGSRRAKKQSCSTRQGLRVGTSCKGGGGGGGEGVDNSER